MQSSEECCKACLYFCLRNAIRVPLLLSQECYEACLANKACGRWIWCSHSRGCDEMGTFMDSFPNGSCQLNTAQLVNSPRTSFWHFEKSAQHCLGRRVGRLPCFTALLGKGLEVWGVQVSDLCITAVQGGSPYPWNRGPQLSSFASGYISGDLRPPLGSAPGIPLTVLDMPPQHNSADLASMF